MQRIHVFDIQVSQDLAQTDPQHMKFTIQELILTKCFGIHPVLSTHIIYAHYKIKHVPMSFKACLRHYFDMIHNKLKCLQCVGTYSTQEYL